MVEEYSEQTQRSAVCHSTWRRRDQQNQVIQVSNRTGAYSVRKAELEGRQHLVVPVVILVEGVHCGNAGCIHYSADVLRQSASAWNGVPVPVHHPYDDQGNPQSCNQPAIVDQQVVGRLYNAHVQGPRLKAELWFDEERLRTLDPDLYNRVQRSEMVEVSTGLTAPTMGAGGVWNGEKFDASALSLQPDHVAVLPGEIGACSIEDGCGIRNREEEGEHEMTKETDTQEEGTDVGTIDNSEGSGVLNKLKGLWDRLVTRSISNEMSLTELHQQMQVLLDSMDSDTKVYIMENLYKDYVVYQIRPGHMAHDAQPHFYKADYTVNADGSIELGDPVEVSKQTDYVEISVQSEENPKGGNDEMTKREIIQKLVEHSGTQWGDEDQDVLNQFTDEQLGKMVPVENEDATPPTESPEEEKTEEATPPTDPSEEVENAEMVASKFLEQVPEEIRDVLESGLAMRNARRGELVDQIMNAQGNTFNKEQLTNRSVEDLEGIASLARPVADDEDNLVSYVGNVGAPVAVQESYDKPLEVPTMEDIFADKA